MSQSGYTPIQLYNSSTASAAPAAGNLVAGELAVNTTDKKIYTKDSGGAVVQVASGPSATDTLTNKSINLANNTLTTTSAQLATAVSDETGSGSLVFGTSPTLTTPVIAQITNTGTLTLPTSTDTLVGRATTDTLTNKTISGAANTITNVSLTTGITGTLPVANGGTGATTLTANNVLLGNGASAPQFVAPSTSGNVLTSNGTTWQSTAPAAGGISAGLSIALSMVMGF